MPAANPELPAEAGSAGRRPATVAEARAMAHPLRLRIIRLLFDRSLTNRELARALGENPATVLHHVRTLLRTGFIAPEPERRGPRGNVEKPYRSTGRSWTLSVDDAPAAADVSQAALEAFLAELRDAQPADDLHTTRLAVNLTPARRHELETRMTRLLDEYARRPSEPADEPWSVFVATHRRAPFSADDSANIASSTSRPDPSDAPANIQLIDREPDDEMAVLLVRAQWAELTARYGVPEHEPESIRNPDAFRPPAGAFVGLAVDGEAVACGGLCAYRFDEEPTPLATAELKAVYVAPLHRGRGYGRMIVEALETRAARLGYRALRLETGDAQPEAIGLYQALGYTQIERFGVYRDEPRSVCFERILE